MRKGLLVTLIVVVLIFASAVTGYGFSALQLLARARRFARVDGLVDDIYDGLGSAKKAGSYLNGSKSACRVCNPKSRPGG